MNRDTEESVRWLLTSSIDIRMIRSRIHGVDSLTELRTWVAVYNELRDQMPRPRQDAIVEAIEKRHQSLTDD